MYIYESSLFLLRPMKKTQILHTGLNKLLNIVLYILGAHVWQLCNNG